MGKARGDGQRAFAGGRELCGRKCALAAELGGGRRHGILRRIPGRRKGMPPESERMQRADSVRCVEIVDAGNPLFLSWLDLYETAFPACERALVSDLLRALAEKARGAATNLRFLAFLDDAGESDGMALVSAPAGAAAWLWYFAVRPSGRCRGLGSAFYREIARQVQMAGCPGMVLEVEIPPGEPGEAGQEEAVRRIAFYRRLGARLLGGIDYWQRVGWHQAPVPMHVMVHSFDPAADAGAAFALAQSVFQDAIRQVGDLTLE